MAALTQVADDIWRKRQPISIVPGFILPAHMTVIRHSDNALWIHSPVNLDTAEQAELAALGEVKDIVAPNLFHHKWFATLAHLYPSARTHAPRELSSKTKDAPTFTALSSDSQVFSPALETYHLAGIPTVDEFVFFHPASRTLLLTDLAFNMNGSTGILTPLILALAGTRRGLQCSRIIKSQISDKQALERSLQNILALEFERVLVAHGDPVDVNAKQRLSMACQRLIG